MGYVGCNEYAAYVYFRYFVQPTYWELGYVESDEYELYVFSCYFVQPTYWELENVESDEYGFCILLRFFVQPVRRRLGHVLFGELLVKLHAYLPRCNSISGKIYVCFRWYWNATNPGLTQTVVV